MIATQIRKDSTRKSAAIILAPHDMRSHTITTQKRKKPNLCLKCWNTLCMQVRVQVQFPTSSGGGQ